MPVKISIAICTHNRAQHLADCLAALMPQMRPGFEVLVVDSASSPGHREAVAETVAAYPGIVFWRLEQPGVALARNALLARAQGEWLATIDDDAIPAPDWVAVAEELAGRAGERYAIVGGAVHPILPPGAVPPMGRRWMQLISAIELDGEYDQTERPLVVGANMWFRVSPLREIGGYPESLGYVGKSFLGGEDKRCVHLLLEKGWRIWYCGRLKVGHTVHRERLSRAWATRRAYWDGIGDRRIQRMLGSRVSALDIATVIAKTSVLALLYPVPSPRHEFFLRFWYNLGWMRETFRPEGSAA